MKKCPTCDKTFDDNMRFCQTDGTPLVEVTDNVEPADPYKTMVAGKDEIAAAMEPADPFKTMVAGSMPPREASVPPKEEEDDVLQLPEEPDMMKTMVVPPVGSREPARFESIKEEIKPEVPAEVPAEPVFTPEPQAADPEPPKFAEPSLSPPSFGDLSGQDSPAEDPASDTGIGESPFSKPNMPPTPVPFDKPKFESPSSPFDQPASAPFEPPAPAYNETPPPSFGSPTPFDEPQQPFSNANDPFNQPFGQPLQQNDWNPPPAPVAGWQEQGIGSNTPFQPPVAAQGLNQTLPIISLVFGILSVCCYVGWLTGLVALITGYMGIKNANNDPSQYGGKGLAIAGMIVGGIFFLISIAYILYVIFVLGMVGLMSIPS